MDGRIHVNITEEIKKKSRELKLDLTAICRDAITEVIKKQDPDYIIRTDPFIILAQCPFCHEHTQTSTIHIVRCKWCAKRFRVHTKQYGLRGKLVSGQKDYEKAVIQLYK